MTDHTTNSRTIGSQIDASRRAAAAGRTRESLLCTIAALRQLARWYDDCTDEARAISRERDGIESAIGRERDRAREVYRERGDAPYGVNPSDLLLTRERYTLADDMRALVERIDAAAEVARQWRCMAGELAAHRETLIASVVPRNRCQADLLSVLIATRADRAHWRGELPSRNHYGDAIHCIAADRLCRTRSLRELSDHFGAPDTLRERRGRVSRKRGEQCLQYAPHRYAPAARATIGDGHPYRAGYLAQRVELLTGARRQRLVDTHAMLQRALTAQDTSEALSALNDYRIRSILCHLHRRTDLRHRAALLRLVRSVCPCPSVVQATVISRPEPAGTITATIGDSVVQLAVVRWRVELENRRTTASDYQQWEYGVAAHDSAIVSPVLRHLSTYHSTERDDDAAREAIAGRIPYAVRQHSYAVDRERDAAAARERQRQRLARTARTLRTLPRVTLDDSYAVGNCRPGTADFCRQLGITSASISGRELCQHWRQAGWPDNSLFIRVVDRLAREAANAK